MQHLNPYRFYELAAKLHALLESTSQHRVTDMFGPLTEAQSLLDGWIKGEPYPLETSKSEANNLLNKIGNLFNKYYIDQSTKQLKRPAGEDRIDAHEITLVANALEKFEHALAAELTHAPTYTAGKRGIFSTYDLIENAAQSFSPAMREHMPTASLIEFGTAGRALAFGLGTSAGMHLLRAVELVLKKFYETFSGTLVGRNERTYSIYLKKLAALSEDEANNFRPDKRLLQLLAQIKENYRNPLTNPESNITLEQATALFSLATAAMNLMMEQIIDFQNKKANPNADTSGQGEESAESDELIPDVPVVQAQAALSEVAAAAKKAGRDETARDTKAAKKAG